MDEVGKSLKESIRNLVGNESTQGRGLGHNVSSPAGFEGIYDRISALSALETHNDAPGKGDNEDPDKGHATQDRMGESKVRAKAIIAVPLYNEAQYIAQTIGSLQRVPPNPDLKFFICDNQSTDNSFEIIREMVGGDSRFILHQHKENVGAAANFEHVFFNSESEYFMWLGGHDQIDAGYPAAAIQIFDSHPDAAYAAGDPYEFVEDPVVMHAKPMPSAKYQFHEERLIRYLQSVGQLANCTLVNSMFRRSFLDDFEFRTTISNDHVLISHMLWHGKIYYTEGQKYYRRFFQKERGSQHERVTGKSNVVLDRVAFYDYYMDSFERLYNRPGHVQSYLMHKILALLEQRFGLSSFEIPIQCPQKSTILSPQ